MHRAHPPAASSAGPRAEPLWDEQYAAWAKKNPAAEKLLHRMKERQLPEGWDDALPSFPADEKGLATRKASSAVIQAIAKTVPELWGGSADLAESNNTTIEGAPSFLPPDRATKMWNADPLAGRVLHFGIREHGMGAVMNGIAVHGGTRVFGGTFLTFSDYMRGAVRLAALMQLPVTYVWTHDSIGLGEDGPTHQPVEHLAALRAIPGLDVVRPGDANETVACWQTILEHNDRPAGLILTPPEPPGLPARRGRLRHHRRRRTRAATCCSTPPTATPTSCSSAPAPRSSSPSRPATLLAEKGVAARVVSMPCREWFDAAALVLPRDRHPPDRQGAGLGRGRRRPGLARGRRRPRPDRLPRPLRRLRRLRAASTASSGSPPRQWPTRPRTASASPPAEPAPLHPPATLQEFDMTDHLSDLSAAGVSIWLDDLSRERLETGNLADLVKNDHVVGVTTNPSIFAAALSHGERYDDQVRAARRRRRRRRPTPSSR